MCRRVPGRVRTATALATTLGRGIVVAGVATLLGCAAARPSTSDGLGVGSMQEVGEALTSDRPERARVVLEQALRRQPDNGYLHLLYGLSYQLADRSPAGLEMAKVGYDIAGRFAADYYWTRYLLGSVALERRQYREAAERFSEAALVDTSRPQAFVGLAVAAYYAGQLDVASLAADRAYALAPQDSSAVRTAAYVAAARGDRERLETISAAAQTESPGILDAARDQSRLDQLLRIAVVEQGVSNPRPAPSAAPAAGGLKQVLVEVTLLLSQNATLHHTGLNLLDGLMIEFGAGYTSQDNVVSQAADMFAQMFTYSIRVPEVSYSLNVFNTQDQYYSVLARPSLVAGLGETSEFFIGRRINVGVSGINLGSVEPIDVGTFVKVTPLEITSKRTKFRIDTARSFLIDQASGSFDEELTAFKQTVGATVEVDFGRTLVLSGLYEAVNFGERSKVPGLGDVWGFNMIFNDRTKTEKKDAAIILVTPHLPGVIDTGQAELPSQSLSRLLSLWKRMIDPQSDLEAVVEELGWNVPIRIKAQPGDLDVPGATDAATRDHIVNETLLWL